MRNLQKAFYQRTIKICRFEIIDGVKYVYCIIKARLQISSEGTIRVCGRSLTFASMCFLYNYVMKSVLVHCVLWVNLRYGDKHVNFIIPYDKIRLFSIGWKTLSLLRPSGMRNATLPFQISICYHQQINPYTRTIKVCSSVTIPKTQLLPVFLNLIGCHFIINASRLTIMCSYIILMRYVFHIYCRISFLKPTIDLCFNKVYLARFCLWFYIPLERIFHTLVIIFA